MLGLTAKLIFEHILRLKLLLTQTVNILLAFSFELSKIMFVGLLGHLKYLLQLIHLAIQDEPNLLRALAKGLILALKED